MQDKWIKCSEEMPQDSGLYVCWVNKIGSRVRKCIRSALSGKMVFWINGGIDHKVTHWQKLPEQPKE